jgi:antirestriction protein ArdC
MPGLNLFNTPEHFYSTAFHELVHWTGAKDRLDRQLSTRFGSQAYAAEELVAEMGAAFLAADWSIENVTRQDHASYLSNWLALMKKDKRALVTAASLASKAVAYLKAQAVIEERIAA